MSETTIVLNLPELAGKINVEHAAAQASGRTALEHALEAGRLLREAKALCLHGEWATWLQANFTGSVRTAQAYQRLHLHRAELASNAQSPALLTCQSALEAIATPRPESLPSGRDRADAAMAEAEDLALIMAGCLKKISGVDLPAFDDLDAFDDVADRLTAELRIVLRFAESPAADDAPAHAMGLLSRVITLANQAEGSGAGMRLWCERAVGVLLADWPEAVPAVAQAAPTATS